MTDKTTVTPEERYQQAIDLCKHAVDSIRIVEAKEIFLELGDYKECASYIQRCDRYLSFGKGNVVEFGAKDGEPLRWKVLVEAGKNRLLLAEKNVAYMPYHVDRDHTNWAGCSMRRWLNKEFLEESFSLRDRMSILLMQHINGTDPRWSVENGPATKDKAFVFDMKDLNEYLPTEESRAIGEWWWLRGHGSNLLSPMAVYDDGSVYWYGVNKNSDTVGVRPAIWMRPTF